MATASSKIKGAQLARLGEQELKVTGASRDRKAALTFLGKDVAKGTVLIGLWISSWSPPLSCWVSSSPSTSTALSTNPPALMTDDRRNRPEVKIGDTLMETTGGERVSALSIDTNGDFTNTFVVEATFQDVNEANKLTPGTYRVRVRGLDSAAWPSAYHLPRARDHH